MPIYMMGEVQLDPRILVSDDQLQTIRRLADEVWSDYREQCKKIAADNQVTILMAMICTSIYHTNWDEILGLASAIMEMVQAEMVMNLDIGQFMFALKCLEMFRTATFYFNVGLHHGSRSMAIRMLEPIIHAQVLEAVAEHKANQIGGTSQPVIATISLTDADGVGSAAAHQSGAAADVPTEDVSGAKENAAKNFPVIGDDQGRG